MCFPVARNGNYDIRKIGLSCYSIMLRGDRGVARVRMVYSKKLQSFLESVSLTQHIILCRYFKSTSLIALFCVIDNEDFGDVTISHAIFMPIKKTATFVGKTA